MFKIGDIKESMQGAGDLHNPADIIRDVAFDSRQIGDGRHTLFLCLPGEWRDGHDYAEHAYANGVRNFITSRPLDLDANVIIVDDVLKRFQEWMKHYRLACQHTTFIGITGSNGKTVVKEWLYQLLQSSKKVTKSPRSYNSSLGVPISLSHVSREDDMAIIEAGISASGEMQLLADMIQPTVGVFTNIGSAHDEGFRSRAEKIAEKARLFYSCRDIIYRKDHLEIDSHLTTSYSEKNLISWGYHPDATYKLEDVDAQGIKISWDHDSLILKTKQKDYITVENMFCAMVTALHLGISKEDILSECEHFLQPAMRMELVEGIDDSILINDAYSSDIQSLKHAIQYAENQDQKRPLTIILSDLDHNQDEKTTLSQVSELLKGSRASRLISIGKSSINLHANGDHYHFPDTPSLYAVIDEFDWGRHIILIKGARRFKLDILAEKLEKKSHSATLEIDLTALHHNITQYEKLLSDNTRLIAVIKASAYGAGIEKLAREIDGHDPAYLAVANADEGLLLRQMNIDRRIIVLNPDPEKIDVLFSYRLEPEVYSFPMLETIAQQAEGRQEHIHIHLKMDSGMGRLGFRSGDAEAVKKILHSHRFIQVATVFSHLSSADDPAEDNYSLQQIKEYGDFYDELTAGWDHLPKRHILNSSGAKRFPEHHYDYVRLGIGLYGIGVPTMPSLLPVHRLEATIISIKKYASGESIGYNRSAILKEETVIGVINIGYADGLMRHGSQGKIQFYYQGHHIPTVGNICMDMTMVDLSSVALPQVGDRVEIFGTHITLDALAEQLDTIPYEILTRIAPRVKRKYIIQ